MRTISILSLLFILAVITAGCSGDVSSPVNPPDTPDYTVFQPSEPAHERESDSIWGLWGMWNISFDLEKMTATAVPVRNLEAHYNVTPMITPPACDDCVQLAVNSFNPTTRIIDVDVTLRNPTDIPGRDVRGILYTNDYGHELRNDDDWTKLYDIPGGGSLNPFKAFAKTEPNRIFAGLAEHTENYLVYIPKPPHYEGITYAVTASWPGNCKEPYEIYDFTQVGVLYDYVGASTELSVWVADWQDDVDQVTLVAPDITGEGFTPFTHAGGDMWGMTITNAAGAAAGEYTVRIIATSANSGETALYDYFTILVTEKVGPVVMGIDPENAEAGANLTDVTITGAKFEGPGVVVKLSRFPLPDIDATNVNVVDPTTITCDFNIPFDCIVGYWDVVVINGDATSGSGDDLFRVRCPVPFINSANPEIGYQGGVYKAVGIGGGKFRGPAEVKLKQTGEPDIVATNVVVENFFLIHCDISIPEAAAIGDYDVEVTNDCGAVGTGAGLFEITTKKGWAVTWGVAEDDEATGVAVTSDDYIYVCGYRDGGDAAWVRKFENDGNVLWGESWADSMVLVGSARANGVAVDSYGVYVAGQYNGTVNFNTQGSNEQTSNGSWDAFILAFDHDGVYRWAAVWGGANADAATAITETYDYICATGYFQGTVDFAPGGGVDEETSNAGSIDVFVSHFYPYGSYHWSTQWGGTGTDMGWGIAGDDSFDIFVTGEFEDTVDFDITVSTDNKTSNGDADIFLSWITWNEGYRDARTWGGLLEDIGQGVAYSQYLDLIFVTGVFRGNVDFDTDIGGEVHSTAGGADAFLSTFAMDSPDLDYYQARTWGGTGYDEGVGVASEHGYMTYVSGYFSGTADFDPGLGEDLHTAGAQGDAFLNFFNSGGTWLRARTWGGDSWDSGLAVAVDSAENAYTVGYFRGDVDFDPGPGEDWHTSNALEDDNYVLKLHPSGYWE